MKCTGKGRAASDRNWGFVIMGNRRAWAWNLLRPWGFPQSKGFNGKSSDRHLPGQSVKSSMCAEDGVPLEC